LKPQNDESFAKLLTVGGHKNSLGEVGTVIERVLHDASLLAELYDCLFNEDAWVRMRAADAMEKVARLHPDWLEPYVDRLLRDFSVSTQPSIQWHLAQIYSQVKLSDTQKRLAIAWLEQLLASSEIDWIVAANAMDTLAQFTRDGSVPTSTAAALVTVQLRHTSKAVVRRANKILDQLSSI
jgi:hypothetical protein